MVKEIKEEQLPQITEVNYYSREIDKSYISASQIKAFDRVTGCQTAAMAKLEGLWETAPTAALLIGSYTDAALDSDDELERFIKGHSEVYNSKTHELKADFRKAANLVERCMSDPLFRALTYDAPISGHQYIVAGEIGGIPTKGKLDYLLTADYCSHLAATFPHWSEFFQYAAGCGGLIVDLKTAANTQEEWDDGIGEKVPWLKKWHYDRQLAIYQELIRQKTGQTLPVLVVCVTKESTPSLLALTISQGDLDEALADAEQLAPEVFQVKNGLLQPAACGHCAYCRAQRKLESLGPLDYRFAADF